MKEFRFDENTQLEIRWYCAQDNGMLEGKGAQLDNLEPLALLDPSDKTSIRFLILYESHKLSHPCLQ